MLKQIGLGLTWFIFPVGFFGYHNFLAASNRLNRGEENSFADVGLVGTLVICLLLFIAIRQSLRKF